MAMPQNNVHKTPELHEDMVCYSWWTETRTAPELLVPEQILKQRSTL